MHNNFVVTAQLVSLFLLAACASTADKPIGNEADPALEASKVPELSGRWVPGKIECLSGDSHLRADMEIDLSSNFFALMGTQSETDEKICRSAVAYRRVSTSFSSKGTVHNESGSLFSGAEKISCWNKPQQETDSAVSDDVHDISNAKMTYQLVLKGEHLDVKIKGWPECSSLHLEASAKK